MKRTYKDHGLRKEVKRHLKILKNKKHPNLLLPEANRKGILTYVRPRDAQHSVGLRLRNFPPSLRLLVQCMGWGGMDKIKMIYNCYFSFKN